MPSATGFLILRSGISQRYTGCRWLLLGNHNMPRYPTTRSGIPPGSITKSPNLHTPTSNSPEHVSSCRVSMSGSTKHLDQLQPHSSRASKEVHLNHPPGLCNCQGDGDILASGTMPTYSADPRFRPERSWTHSVDVILHAVDNSTFSPKSGYPDFRPNIDNGRIADPGIS